MRRFAASGPGSWLFARVLHHIDRPVFRVTGGRHTFASLVSGLDVAMITTTGSRSGLRRTVPVLGLDTADGLAVIASNYGQAHHPAWYYNLRADPAGEVVIDGVSRRFRAVEAHGDQRDRIWQQGLRSIRAGRSTSGARRNAGSPSSCSNPSERRKIAFAAGSGQDCPGRFGYYSEAMSFPSPRGH